VYFSDEVLQFSVTLCLTDRNSSNWPQNPENRITNGLFQLVQWFRMDSQWSTEQILDLMVQIQNLYATQLEKCLGNLENGFRNELLQLCSGFRYMVSEVLKALWNLMVENCQTELAGGKLSN